MSYETIIGLEIHIQAKTKSKMFCSCDAEYFGSEPNSHVCPVCLGLPGALPVPNKIGIEQAMRLALALNCQISSESKFDRKNYFYPDLPKGYQITQYDQPIGHDGFLEIEAEGDARRIRIRRLHLEEDTGKSIHGEGHNTKEEITLLDFNKSGVPLIEVVTEPDFQSVQEVISFAKLLKQTVVYTGVSEAEMQKGQMRFELNISLRRPEDGAGLPPYRVEVKNIGSISVLEKVIAFEVDRQSKLLSQGETLKNETRGLKDMTGETLSQRVKETEDDYRYFPEPDIPPFELSDKYIQEIRESLPELPMQRVARYRAAGLEASQAEVLVEQSAKGDWFDLYMEITESGEEIKEGVKWLIGDISAYLEKLSVDVTSSPITQEDLLFLVRELKSNNISGTIAKKVIDIAFTKGGTPQEIIESEGLVQISDNSQVESFARKAIEDNPKIVASISKNPNAYKALIGEVMRASKGQTNPTVVDQVLRDILKL